jgi:hypothetical protein
MRHKQGIEESPKLTRKLLLSILAVVPALMMPLAATSQIAPDRPARAERTERTYKYEAFAGYGYTSLNQVNQSRNGLQGVDFSLTRDWGKYFGLTADGGVYQYAYDTTNPGSPSVDMVLFGPVVHANLYGRVDGFIHVLLGGEHTAGENATPNISFAGGFGGGLDYKLSPHFALRVSGDKILSSFAANTDQSVCSASSDCSPHERSNARASLGLVYRF